MKIGKRRLMLVLVFSSLAWLNGAAAPRARADDFLEHLAGSWTLTGAMGATRLHQRVEAKWVVQGRFLQMHFLQEDKPAPGQAPYEAIYVLGYDADARTYVLHLFDTFGPAYSRTIGTGTRQGDSVEFLFDYAAGPFSNTFSWDPKNRQWTMLLRQKKGAEWVVFANKTLTQRRGR